MTDHPKRSRWKRRALIAFVVLLPVWYVLSIGPMTALHTAVGLPEPVQRLLTTLYWPISLLAAKSVVFRDFVNWYVGLWIF